MTKPRRHAKKINPLPPAKVDFLLLAAEVREAGERLDRRYESMTRALATIQSKLENIDLGIAQAIAGKHSVKFVPIDSEGLPGMGSDATAVATILRLEMAKTRDENQRLQEQLTQARRDLANGERRWRRRRGVK
jgi:hypothetical protein